MGTPVNLLLSSQSARAYFFPQSVKIHYFCSDHISVDPVCPQHMFVGCTCCLVRSISLLRASLPMDMRIPPLKLKILLESSPLRSRILVRRLAVPSCGRLMLLCTAMLLRIFVCKPEFSAIWRWRVAFAA